MQLNKDDVERIAEGVLRGLSLELNEGGFTDPNSRCVILKHEGAELSRVYFDVVQKREYEG
jgi:hypothetical protein